MKDKANFADAAAVQHPGTPNGTAGGASCEAAGTPKILFDAHAHINEESYSEEDRNMLASEIEASQVRFVMDAGNNLATSQQSILDAATYPWAYAVVGVHPHDARELNEENFQLIREMYAAPKVCGIGEIGLDFFYDRSERDVQRYWFRRQIQLANELGAPIVIHTREADQETMDILKEEGAFSAERKALFPKRPAAGTGGEGLVDDARVLIHCFSGSLEMARQYVKLGATISICGPVTFKNNRKTAEVAKEIPIEYLTVETDSPYLAPEPKRGRPNMSPYVQYVARRVAVLKGMPYEEVARITCDNAMRFYGIE
jgi:TatD DNase family protein